LSQHTPDPETGSILSAFALEEQHRILAGPVPGAVGGATPPKYSHLVPTSPRFPVFPRDEEGVEQLPGYKSSIEMSGMLTRKMELLSPFDSAPSRNWHNIFLVSGCLGVLDYLEIKLTPGLG
jgi:hypothetical protein